MTMKLASLAGAAFGLGLAAIGTTSAYAAVIDGITVTNAGRIDPSTAPVIVQPLPIGTGGGFVGQTEIGQATTIPPNLPTLPNPGWDAYGAADTTHSWWNVYSGYADFGYSGTTLSFLWGSPNNLTSSTDANYITFFNSSNTALGTVTAADLASSFGVNNTTDPGYLLTFMTGTPFSYVRVGTVPSDFEFAFTAGVPEPATWAMMMAGFAGVAFLGLRRKRQPVALTL
jgi:hypothetical protein